MIELEPGWLSLTLFSAFIASVHVWLPWLDERYARYQAQWGGFVGGIALGYVTLYMLPKLGQLNAELQPVDAPPDLVKMQIYLLLLGAIVLYLIMERLDRSSGRLAGLAGSFDYLVHGSYSFLVGYVYVEFVSDSLWRELMVAIILTLHLVGMVHILRTRRPGGYAGLARWSYLALVMTGAALGLLTEFPKSVINALTAFLAGIILVNVISEELPTGPEGRLRWFAAGVGTFLLLFWGIIELR